MTSDRTFETDAAFEGLMKNLNLDESQFQRYSEDFKHMDFQELVATKKKIDEQLNLLFDVLKTQYKADMDTPLVIDGFPRSDIDVVSVRLLRVKIIRVRNDLKEIMTYIQKQLEYQLRKQADEVKEPAEKGETKENPLYQGETFATVNLVAPNGPADQAGLKEGDRIVEFKNVNSSTNNKLAHISVATKGSVGSSFNLVIERENERMNLSITPSESWGGRGLLGCQLKIDDDK